jgi:hypothetical protein
MCEDRLCPQLVALDATRAVLDDLADIHDSPDAVRGATTAIRKSVEAVRSSYPCDGPARDEGLVRCPLESIINDVRFMATVPINRQGWAFLPEKLAGAETDSTTGQYL